MMSKTRTAASIAALVTVTMPGGACTHGNELLGTVTTRPPDAGATTPACPSTCAKDKRAVIRTCDDGVVTSCGPTEECDDGRCVDGCSRAGEQMSSVGCDYYAVQMDIVAPEGLGACFVTFVANAFSAHAHLAVTLKERPIDLARYAKVPVGQGRTLEYADYDPARGLAPGEVAVIFLSSWGSIRCPVPAPRSTGAFVRGSGIGNAFHVTSDVPVSAFQMLPYGGGSASMTGASLLLPTTAWGTNYVAVNAYEGLGPSLDIVALDDDTTIQITPRAAIREVPGLLRGAAPGIPTSYTLRRGEVLQLTQREELTGSPIASNKPIGLFGGHQCMSLPRQDGYCDHAEQQIAPVHALGSEYVALPHRARRGAKAESYYWRIVGAAPETALTYDPPTSGPTTIGLGEHAELISPGPFTVRSQDARHPFMLFGYMTGGESFDNYGDPDFVRVIPPRQWQSRYLFFTDPTYPETSLAVVRERTLAGSFEDVTLDCYGVLQDWTPLGDDYEIARTDLVRHDFERQGRCDNGAHEMFSKAPFALTVWGWGGPETSGGLCAPKADPQLFTCNVSYAYPGGERVVTINDVFAGPALAK